MVHALLAAGHEVAKVDDLAPGSEDEPVAAMANAHSSILLTEDRDFGRLVYVLNRGLHGVIYVRWPAHARSRLGPTLV